jgi:DNA-binding response OmpR family regulator
MKILVVEDDERILRLLEKTLSEDGHAVAMARAGQDALEMTRVAAFDAVILDVMLPQMNGFALVEQMRRENNRTPVVFLTARDTLPDLVKGLDLGADDYITKPFQLEELLARVRALGRRGAVFQSGLLKVADLSLDRAKREAVRGDRRILLTKKEYVVLELLMRRTGHSISRDDIIDAGWGINSDASANAVEVLISSLRSKVDGNEPKKLIKTVRGFGYILSADFK